MYHILIQYASGKVTLFYSQLQLCLKGELIVKPMLIPAGTTSSLYPPSHQIEYLPIDLNS